MLNNDPMSRLVKLQGLTNNYSSYAAKIFIGVNGYLHDKQALHSGQSR